MSKKNPRSNRLKVFMLAALASLSVPTTGCDAGAVMGVVQQVLPIALELVSAFSDSGTGGGGGFGEVIGAFGGGMGGGMNGGMAGGMGSDLGGLFGTGGGADPATGAADRRGFVAQPTAAEGAGGDPTGATGVAQGGADGIPLEGV